MWKLDILKMGTIFFSRCHSGQGVCGLLMCQVTCLCITTDNTENKYYDKTKCIRLYIHKSGNAKFMLEKGIDFRV